MITQRMVRTFGYRIKLWDVSQCTPFEWNLKTQTMKLSSRWKFILWTSNILHTSCYILLPLISLLRLVWVTTDFSRTELAVDCLHVMLGTTVAFVCMSVALSRHDHVAFVNEIFSVDKQLTSKTLWSLKYIVNSTKDF